MPLLPTDGKRSWCGSLGDGSSTGTSSSASSGGANDPPAAGSTKTKVSLGKQPSSPRPAAMEVQRSRHRTKRRAGAGEVVDVQVEVTNVPASRLDTPPPKTPPRASSHQPSPHSSPSVVVGIPLAEAEYGSPAFVLGAHPYGSGHFSAMPGAGRYGPSPLADSKDGLAGKAPARFKCGDGTGREAGANKPPAFAGMLEFDSVQVEEEDMPSEEAAAVEEAILSSLQTAAIDGSAGTEKVYAPAAACSTADGESRGERSGRGDGKPRLLTPAEEEDQYGWPPSPPRPPPRGAGTAPLLSPQRSDGARPRRRPATPPVEAVLPNPDATREAGGGSEGSGGSEGRRGGEGSGGAVAAGAEQIAKPLSFPRVGD